MEREAGLGDGTGPRGNELEVRGTYGGVGNKVEQAQAGCVDARPQQVRGGADVDVGDSATWVRCNSDVDASVHVPALKAAGGQVVQRAEQVAAALVD